MRISDWSSDVCSSDLFPAGRAHRAAHGLGDRLIGLALGVGPGAEALDRGVDDARVDLPDAVPREALPVEHAGPEILDQHVAALEQLDEELLPLRRLDVALASALVAFQHRDIVGDSGWHIR